MDAPTCHNVVLARVIGSMTEFKQIIGRGTRVRDDKGKFFFNILDYTGSATRLFADPEFDGEHPEPRKYYVRGGAADIDTEVTYDLDADGSKLRTVQITQYAAETVKTLYTDPEDLRKKWSDFEQRSAVVEMLEVGGIDFNELAASAQKPDADPFDLLCHLAYNAPLLTRRERAEKLRRDKNDFFDQFGPEARTIIGELLDKYADHGTAQFSIPDVFEVPPIAHHGNLKEIAAKFGGTEKLMEAVKRLQEYLYAA